MYTIEDVKPLAMAYAQKIDSEVRIASLWNLAQLSDLVPYIKVDSAGLHYLRNERGLVYEHQTTQDINELLYWVFSDCTFGMAHDFENKNREAQKDGRRLIHSKQLELLEKLNLKWRDLEKQKQEQILRQAPYDDFGSLRASYIGELRRKGYAEDEIQTMAYEIYPLND